MKRIKKFFKIGFLLAGGLFVANAADAQCGTFADSENPEAAETAHVLYRQDAKQKNYDGAYENWVKAYEMAPGADGQRDVHYTDGIKILTHKLKAETDEAKKAEYKAQIVELYDAVVKCLENGGLNLPKVDVDQRVAFHMGRKAFAQFYDLQTPYVDNIKSLAAAIEKGGNDTEYTVLYPYAYIAVREFTEERLTKEEARAIADQLNGILDYNIENNEKFKDYYVQTKASVQGEFAAIERNIYDCAYFVEKVRPAYEASPNDPAVLKETITILKQQGCKSGEGVALLDEAEASYAKFASELNAQRQAEFEANNPALLGKRAYDAGDYPGAIAKYREALDGETESSRKADIYFRIASIQGRKMGQNGQARTNARNALKENPSLGKAYMLIGDLYAKSSRNCGKDGYTRGLAVLAAISKYRQAKNVDSSVSADANKKIGIYKKSIPTKEDVFMRGMQGKSAKVGCWIGESVKVEYQ